MSNPYECGTQKIIPAVLLYAFHHDRVLMIHRNLKKDDYHREKWNGLGGKLETGESFPETAVREFQEECGISTLSNQWKWLGQLYFPDFKPQKNEDWWVNVLFTDLDDEQANLATSEEHLPNEGTLHWVETSQILSLNLWEGDRNFIPLVLNRTPFQGTLFYKDGKCTRSEIFPICP